MFLYFVLKEVLGEINSKLAAVNNELSLKMAENVNSRPSPQAQYCGPYKLEKTLGKGQTGGISTNLIINFIVNVSVYGDN